MTCGVVVSKRTGWQQGNSYRGGNCIWVFDPVNKALVYYAHMKEIKAEVGDIVDPGTCLGMVGRTGKNALKKRSKTHLHIMYLQYPDNGIPFPKRFYNDLVKAKPGGPAHGQ
jgi:murein DD-endopeptidase MepM/ murein hydrolase activator NlpD